MNADITPLVAATVARNATQTRLDLERLRCAREATGTVSRGGQTRALSLGRRIRFLEQQSAAWDAVVAFTADTDSENEVLRRATADLALSIGHARHTLASSVLGKDRAPDDMSLEQITEAVIAEYGSTYERAVPADDADDRVTHPPILIGYVAHDWSGFRCVDHEPLTPQWDTLYAGSDYTGEQCTRTRCTRKLGS